MRNTKPSPKRKYKLTAQISKACTKHLHRTLAWWWFWRVQKIQGKVRGKRDRSRIAFRFFL